MKVQTVTKYTFEVGDLFFVVQDNKSAYKRGECILISGGHSRHGFRFTTTHTVDGRSCGCSGSAEFLEGLILSGAISYQGNVGGTQ